MATCKDCLHYELCQYNAYQEAHYFGKDKKIYITIKNNTVCKFFKPTDKDEVSYGTCNTCRCNKVCDHNEYGFENCGNYIPTYDVSKKEITTDGGRTDEQI